MERQDEYQSIMRLSVVRARHVTTHNVVQTNTVLAFFFYACGRRHLEVDSLC
jgi:hypothetical protein